MSWHRDIVTEFDPIPMFAQCDSAMIEKVWVESDIFGPTSFLVTPRITSSQSGITVAATKQAVQPYIMRTTSLTETFAFDSIVFALLFAFTYLMYSYRNSVKILFNVVLSRTSIKSVFEDSNILFRQCLNIASAMGVLLLAGLTIKIGWYVGLEDMMPQNSVISPDLVVFVVVCIVALIALYRIVLTKLISAITQNEKFFTELRFYSKLYAAVIYFFLTPVFIISAQSTYAEAHILLSIAMPLILLLYILYFAKSYIFFISRNVSTFQWILYLCAVELLPISFFILLGVRSLM